MAHKKTGTPRKRVQKKKRKRGRKPLPGMSSADPAPAIGDRRAAEGQIDAIHRLLKQQQFESADQANRFLAQFIGMQDIPLPPEKLTPAEQAQRKMYEAWDATGKKRVILAEEALRISPDCADAYVLLAEDTAPDVEHALKLYEQGVQAGKRALGPELFEQATGSFWGIIESRPYMRARAGVAQCLAALDRNEEAIAHLREMLRLNPHDNQGNRHLLARLLLSEGQDVELSSLLDEYDEPMAACLYTRCLLTFRQTGRSKEARKALKRAIKRNPFVPLYFCGTKRIRKNPPEYMTPGGENEAIIYFIENIDLWSKTPGALEWFVETSTQIVGELKEPQAEEDTDD